MENSITQLIMASDASGTCHDPSIMENPALFFSHGCSVGRELKGAECQSMFKTEA